MATNGALSNRILCNQLAKTWFGHLCRGSKLLSLEILVNTICYNVLKSYNIIATVQTCGHLQLFLVQFVQICTCFLLHCVLLYKKQLQVSHSLHNYLIRF